jgi:hypothetical protein
VTVTDPPHMRLLGTVFVYLHTVLLPILAKYLISKFACCWYALGNVLVEYIHNRVCDSERLILEHRVTRESPDQLTKGGEIPEKAPCRHVGNDEISRGELEVPIWLNRYIRISSSVVRKKGKKQTSGG